MKKEVKALIKNGPFCKVLDKIEEKKCHRAYLKRINTITKQGAYIVHEIEESLNDSGLTFFATCGTLLGLIREGRLLKNDYDMDYGILIEKPDDWKTLSVALSKIGYRKIREFSLNQRVTEETYKGKNGVEIDFFGHFIENGALCFYSYDKLPGVEYPSDDSWTAFRLVNGTYQGTKKIETNIGTVTVPLNAEEYLTYNYNDNWKTPNPDFKANTGKGCTMISGQFGKIKC